ncbi:MAG: 4-hydroxy-tetrahydrodipicolinate synthase [Candidatus Lindowbacteria bacterium]|nr:4-hydroxy-tetrahydrodipicolinate synthase [Candidatus Lindowbacteria bacterium]
MSGTNAAEKLRGSFVAIVTPFTEDGSKVDIDQLKELIEWHIAEGTNGIVPCGTTGESSTLTHDEHKQVVEVTVDTVAGRVPVIAGAGSNSTAEAIELTRHAQHVGADFALSITPYYNKPEQEGLINHFTAVADATDIPIVLYNVPGRTSVSMNPLTVKKCAEHPRIVGIKDATADLNHVSMIIDLCPPDFRVLSGDDFTVLPLLSVGGKGVISVTANVVPKLQAELVSAYEAGDHERAKKIHYQILPLAAVLFTETNPIPVKAAVAELGRCRNVVRGPLTKAKAKTIEELKMVIASLT